MELAGIIQQKIKSEGPISFRDFMEMALYYPGLGYYTSPKEKIGPGGDFYTSANLTPHFGAMIARQMEEMWQHMGKGKFTIVEYGAGTGLLCHDILDYLHNRPEFYEQLRYCVVERSPSMRSSERSHLHEKVSWHASIGDLAPVTGCIFSNELIDNFPVHMVVMDDELREIFVDHSNGFIEILQPAGDALKNYLAELNIILPKGFRTEINLDAVKWMSEISAALKKGYVMTIDYGYPSSELYSEHRNGGTLMCYHKHHLNTDPFQAIGEQDITAHVNFSALCHWGLQNGVACCGITSQANFLLGLGFKDYFREQENSVGNILESAKKEAFLTHALLIDMGSRFKVLIQQKGMAYQQLKGLHNLYH